MQAQAWDQQYIYKIENCNESMSLDTTMDAKAFSHHPMTYPTKGRMKFLTREGQVGWGIRDQ